METLGAYLKSKREALHISLQEISQVTRIRRSILEAIENDRYDLLPPKVFAQGFIRSYASYLGLDENEVIRRYAEQVDVQDADIKTDEVRTSSPLIRIIFIILLIAGLLVAVGVLLKINSPEQNVSDRLPHQSAPATNLVFMTTVPGASAPVASGKEEEEPAGASTSITDAAAQATSTVPGDGSPIESAGQKISGSAGEPPLTAIVKQRAMVTGEGLPDNPSTAPLELRIVASQNTWMRIQSDMQRPVEFTLQEGRTHTVKAMEKFSLRIGNAGGVDLFLNGQPLGKPGRPGEVIQLTLPE